MNAQTASTKPATSAALEITASQQWWTNRQASVLESLFGPNVPEADMMAFLHICQATQLDPFRKQIHLIGRRDKHLGRMVFRAQTGIDGFRVIARRSARQSGEVISQEDHLWCGPDGQWSDIWLKAEPPSATKLAVQRGSGRFSAVALWREYAPDLDGKNVGLWRKMPAHMLGKVVEALVLRKAFPNDLSGLFIAEEFGEDSGSGEQKGAGHAGPPGVQARQPTEDERPMVDAASIAVDEAFARGDEAELPSRRRARR